MRRKFYDIPGHIHFITFSCVHHLHLLSDHGVCCWLAEEMAQAFSSQQIRLYAYVFMPEHVHLLIHPSSEDYSISLILRSIKGPFSRKVLDHWRETGDRRLAQLIVQTGARAYYRFWQAGGGFDRNLSDVRKVVQATEYIEANPVRRGLVMEPECWLWSSACIRVGRAGGPLRIDQLDLTP